MSWIILEGLDRTGKSSVANLYKAKGYDVIHMSAPNKKFTKEGYTGPSYLDEVLELYMDRDDKDTIFDRSPYGEFVWPHVYGRKPQLSEEDFEILQEYENKNSASRILMVDPDTHAHWQRCVESKEDLTHSQFQVALKLYQKLAHEQNFMPQELSDFNGSTENKGDDDTSFKQEDSDSERENKNIMELTPVEVDKVNKPLKSKEQLTLEKANAINKVLSSKIIKVKGPIYESLEKDIRTFLNGKLAEILGTESNIVLTTDEITLLKQLCIKLRK